jgi:hypothetical protein
MPGAGPASPVCAGAFWRAGACRKVLRPCVTSTNFRSGWGWGPPITAARLMTPARRFASVGACLNSSTVSNWTGHLRCSKEWRHEASDVCEAFGHAREVIVCDPRVSARVCVRGWRSFEGGSRDLAELLFSQVSSMPRIGNAKSLRVIGGRSADIYCPGCERIIRQAVGLGVARIHMVVKGINLE